MTLTLTHAFVNAIADDPAAALAGEVTPSNWNANHNLIMSSGYLLGRSSAGNGPVELLPQSNFGTTDVLDYGAVGDGVTDDTASIQNALNANLPVVFVPKTFLLSGSIYLNENTSIEGNGATLLMTAFDTFIRGLGDGVPTSSTVVTANPVAGSNTIIVTSASGISVGDRVGLRLGDNPYDGFQSPIYAVSAVVLGITGFTPATLTLDRIIPYTINVVGATNNKHVDRFPASHYVHDIIIRDLYLDGNGTTVIDGGTILFWARNIVFDHIVCNKRGGLNFGYGFYLEYCENICFRDAVVYHNRNTGGQSSLGRAFDFAACRGIYVYDAVSEDVNNNFCFIEDYCEDVNFFNPVVRHYNNPSGHVIFACLLSKMYVENLRVEMPVSYQVINYGGTYADPFTHAHFHNMTLVGILPSVMPDWPSVSGRVEFNNGTDRFAINIDASVERTMSVPLSAGMSANFQVSNGFLLEFSINASVSNLAQIGAVFLGTTSNNGSNITSQLVANQWVNIVPQTGGIFGTSGNMYGTVSRIMDKQIKLLVTTTGDPGGYFDIRYRVAPYDDTKLTEQNITTMGAAGANTQVQFNKLGILGADPTLFFSQSNREITGPGFVSRADFTTGGFFSINNSSSSYLGATATPFSWFSSGSTTNFALIATHSMQFYTNGASTSVLDLGTDGGLQVFNYINLSNTSSNAVGVIKLNNVPFLHAYPGTSSNNCFFGGSGNFTMTGGTNVAIGADCLHSLTNGTNNMALGQAALYSVTSGVNNCGIGTLNLFQATGSYNVSVGNSSGFELTTGSGNTFIGYGTGRGITTGGSNTVIGSNVIGLPANLTGTIILADGSGAVWADFSYTTASKWTFTTLIAVPGGANPFLTSTSTITGGTPASGVGTLTSGPWTGTKNPDKYIPINDSGTTYWIPAWHA